MKAPRPASNDHDKESSVDVAIVGGGPAGTAAAIGLVEAGLQVRLVERSRYEESRVGEALAPAATHLLRELGAAHVLVGSHSLRRHGVSSIWGHPEVRFHDFLAAGSMSCHVDRRLFDASLASLASGRGVEVHLGAAVRSCQQKRDGWCLTVARDGELSITRAPFLLVATGRAGLPGCFPQHERVRNDRLVAVVRYFHRTGSPASQTRTWIEAVPSGWWYIAPLPHDRIVAVYFTDADLLPPTRFEREAKWAALLQSAPVTQTLLEGQPPVSLPKLVAAGSWYQRRISGERCLAMGDTAMTFDPLSGQGVSRALETGVLAARAVCSVFHGHDGALVEYAANLRRTYRAYLRDRYQVYGLERRWPSAPFWARRHMAGSPPAHIGPGSKSG